MSVPPLPVRSSNEHHPTISVVLTTFNRPDKIGVTIRSILRQSLRDFELLVRDDGSGVEGTAEAVQSAAGNDPRLTYTRNPARLGIPGNLNAGLICSRGDYVVISHDHDRFDPRFLDKLLGALHAHPTAAFAHSGIQMIDQGGAAIGGSFIGPWPPLTPGRDWLDRMLRSYHCPVTALSMIRRSALESIGLLDSRYGFVSDVELWMRLSTAGDVAYVSEGLVEVMTREETHDAVANPWPATASLVAIHADMARSGLWKGVSSLHLKTRTSLRADHLILTMLLRDVIRNGRWQLREAAPAIRRGGGPFARSLLLLSGAGMRESAAEELRF